MAGTATSITTFDAKLKVYYVDKKNLFKMDKQHNKLLQLVPKDPTAIGKSWVQPIESTGIVGDSANYNSGSANYTAGVDDAFEGSWKNRYALGALEDSVIRLSKTDRGAFQSAVVNKLESVRLQMQESTNVQLFRNEGGYLSKLSALSTNTGSLASGFESDAQFIKPGMRLVKGASIDGTNANPATVFTVAVVDQDSGTIGATSATRGNFEAGNATDYLFKDGDPGISLAGLESWIPRTAASAASTFKGVDRTQDVTRFAGSRINGTGMSVREALIKGIGTVRARGGTPSVVFLNPSKFQDLVNELGSNIRYNSVDAMSFFQKGRKAGYGIASVSLACGGEPVEVVEETACQGNLAWILDWGSMSGTGGRKWRFSYTSDGWPYNRGNGTDNATMLRQSGTSYVFELFGVGEMICAAPGHSGVVVLS